MHEATGQRVPQQSKAEISAGDCALQKIGAIIDRLERINVRINDRLSPILIPEEATVDVTCAPEQEARSALFGHILGSLSIAQHRINELEIVISRIEI